METFNTFVKFISDDPVMLALCVAIIALVIVFILVLILGRKKNKKEESTIDNTTELLKTEVNLDALKSTQEYNLSELENASKAVDETVSNQVIETPSAREIPVTTEEPVALEFKEDDIVPNVEVTNFEPTIPTIGLEKESPNVETNDIKLETPDYNIFDKVEPVDSFNGESSIVESVVNPVEDTIEVSTDDVFASMTKREPVLELDRSEEVELPIKTGPIPKVEVPKQEPFSSVYVEPDDEIPSVNPDEFSKTAIIRHIPVMEDVNEVVNVKEEPVEPTEDLDDLDLPMLSSSVDNSSFLNSIKGETFDIK